MKLLVLLISIALILTVVNLAIALDANFHCRAIGDDLSSIKMTLDDWGL